MKRFLLPVLALTLSFASASAQQTETPTFLNKPIDQLTADEVLKLVRYSYTLYNREFTGVLRTVVSNKLKLPTKVPFLMSLKPESIRFIFTEPDQVIYLDTRNEGFNLLEGVGGAKMKPVNQSKYGERVRGTDATYDDLSMRFLYWPNAKIAGREKVKQRECWKVTVRNPDGLGLYSTVNVWIDIQTGGMLRMMGYNAQGRPIRRFEVLHGKKFGDVWMVDEMRIETISPAAGGQVTSSTRMQLKTMVK